MRMKICKKAVIGLAFALVLVLSIRKSDSAVYAQPRGDESALTNPSAQAAPATANDNNDSTSGGLTIEEPVNAMFESWFYQKGTGNTEKRDHIDNLEYCEREMWEGHGNRWEEPVRVSTVPIDWKAGHIFEPEKSRVADDFYYPYGFSKEVECFDSHYYYCGNQERTRKLIQDHPEYAGTYWCQLTYGGEKDSNYYEQRYIYQVEGNRLILKPVEWFFLDQNTGDILYEKDKPEEEFIYEFRDGNLILKKGNSSSELYDVSNPAVNGSHIVIKGVCRRGFETFQGIKTVNFALQDDKDPNLVTGIGIRFGDGTLVSTRYAETGAEATFSRYHIRCTWKARKNDSSGELISEPGEAEFDCIPLSNLGSARGVTLVVDGKAYLYNSTFNDYRDSCVIACLPDEAGDNITENVLSRLGSRQKSVISDLLSVFSRENIQANVDYETGIIRLNSDVSFRRNSADLSEEGKKEMEVFLETYFDVLKGWKDVGYITGVQIDGYADTNGDYDHNLELSQERAEGVLQYCREKVPGLGEMATAVGHSYDNPVMREDGTIDMDASRRVEFRFLLKMPE